MNPTLRFATSDSIDWNLVSIKDLVYPIKSGKSKKNDNGDYVLYGATGIIGHTNDVYNEDSLILVARVGSVGNVSLVYGKFGVSDNVLVVKPNEKSDIGYVYHLLANKVNWKSLSNGTSQLVVSAKKVEDYKIYVANFEEQQKIASFFSTLDDKISLTEKKLSTISRLKKGIFKKILSRNIRFPDEKGNAFPEWSNKKMGEIFSISAGGDLDKSRASKDFNEEFCYKVFANALTNDGLYGYANYYLVDGETITVTGRGDIGYAVARHEKYVPIVRLLVCKPIEKQNVDFYAELINNIRILNESTGVPQLTRPQLAEIMVSVPVLEEQDKIAALINTLNKLIKVNKSKVVQLQKLKQSLLKEMFV